jgi:hypothetical protein
MPVRFCSGIDNVRHCLALVKDYFIGTNPNALWTMWAIVWAMRGQCGPVRKWPVSPLKIWFVDNVDKGFSSQLG